MGKERFLKMTFEELDMEIDSLPYAWMKALMYQGIKSVRPDYVQRHIREREENNNDRKSKSKSSRQASR